jgi:hypothetical protein
MTSTELEQRSRSNLDRVRGLIALYERLSGPVAGRPSVQESDLLRAAVVLLHATLEDFLRSVAMARLPGSEAEVVKQIPLAGSDIRRPTFNLGELSIHRGRLVDEVIADSVDAYLSRVSYNDTDEVAKLLDDIDLKIAPVRPYLSRLAAMMSRRHHIAHRFDRNESSGRGHHQARSISRATVEGWIVAVEGLIAGVLRML